MILGADYASVDGNHAPDFAAASAAGVRFVIVRASYSTSADSTAARDRDAIRAAGLTYGAYAFLVMNHDSPSPEDQVQAAFVGAGLIPGRDLPLVLDVEFPHGIQATGRPRAELGTWIGRAVAAAKHGGCDPVIYSSARVLDGTDSDALAGAADAAIAGCPLWLARYPYRTRIRAITILADLAPPPVPHVGGDADDWTAHQFQGDAVQMPGFSSTVDLSRWNPLRKGARGARVSWVQRQLQIAEGTPAVWDDVTEATVVAFQRDRGLEPDGVIGPATFAAMAWTSTHEVP